MKQSAYFTIEQIYTQLVVRLVYKSTNIIDHSSGLLHFGASILILKTAWEPSCTQYFIQPRNVNKHLYLVVSHYLLFLSLPAAILHLQPVQENIGLHCAESPLLSKRGQPQQKCVRSPAHPQQQVHDGGEECLKVLFFPPLTAPPSPHVPLAISSIYRTVPKKFVMFYFSVKSKYIKVFFGTDYQKKVSLSTNPLKSSKNKTAGYRRAHHLKKIFKSPEKASVFEYCSFSPSWWRHTVMRFTLWISKSILCFIDLSHQGLSGLLQRCVTTNL